MVLKNCWEIKECGREKGGLREADLGSCPACPDRGHSCWTVTGTLCGGEVQGTFAQKEMNCLRCQVYQLYNIQTGAQRERLINEYKSELARYLNGDVGVFEGKTTEEALALAAGGLNHQLEVQIQARTRQLLEVNKQLKDKIEERKRLDGELRKSEQSYTSLVNNVPDYVMRYDHQHRHIFANDGCLKAAGMRRDEFIGKTHRELGFPESLCLLWEKAIDRCFETKQPQTEIFEWESAYGPVVLEWRAIPEAKEDGSIETVLGLSRDITERKRAEESLRESEQELRTIFEGALDGIMVADAETKKFINANAAICSMLGYTHEEIVRIGMSDIHPKQDMPRVTEQFESQLRGEIRIAADTPMMRKDGSVFYAAIKAAPIRLGGKDCLLGIFRDVTERMQAQRELLESEARFRGLVEQSIAGIYIIQDGSLAYANPRFAEIRGYSSADEVIGRDPLQLIAEKDRGTVAELNRRLLAGEMPSIAYSFIALRKDGSSVDVGAHSALATYRGRPAILGLLQDISEKKRAEEDIQRYVAQLKTAFMSTVEVATTLSEMRDPYTSGHERRVAEIAVAIGAELGFDSRRQEGLRVASHLHDIGKITIPAEILSKPGKLSAIERQLVEGHAQASYNVLKAVQWPWPVAQAALQHHERMDGSGYPQGLKGDAILFEARIMAVADVVEAMSSHRPYRAGLGIEAALSEIEHGRGSAYDPTVVDACLKLFREKGYAIPA